MMLAGKRVFLTGASSGLGEALAIALASKGAVTVLASRRVDRLQDLSRRIAAMHPSASLPLPVFCDVSDRVGVSRAMRVAVEQMGGIDILINNAGISVYGEAERTQASDIDELMQVNFLGCVHGMQEAIPYMKRQGRGHIVNIASLAAIHGIPYLAAYGASKAALAAFSQSLRAELCDQGIKVQVIYPGYTQTRIFENEKKVGGARRPRAPYEPVDQVAGKVLRAMERERWEAVLTSKGRMVAALHGVLPRVLDLITTRMATQLQENEVSPHG